MVNLGPCAVNKSMHLLRCTKKFKKLYEVLNIHSIYHELLKLLVSLYSEI